MQCRMLSGGCTIISKMVAIAYPTRKLQIACHCVISQTWTNDPVLAMLLAEAAAVGKDNVDVVIDIETSRCMVAPAC